MPQFLTSIDLTKNELKNARIQNLASAPLSPVEGQIYYNTVDHAFYVYNGTVWLTHIASSEKGAANGVATLDPSSKLTSSQIPVATVSALGGVKDGAGVTIDAGGILSVDYGSSANTAVQGNDTRVTADQAAGTASIRTIGAGALQAAAGNHNHTVDGLFNVQIGTLSDNQVLTWDTTSSKWINQAPTGSTANALSNGTGIASFSFDGSAAATVSLATVSDSGSGVFKKITVDSYGRVTGTTNVVLADLTGLGVSTLALGSTGTTAAAGNHTHSGVYLAVGGGTLTGALTLAADPANPLEAATKQYVDNNAVGLDIKASVKVATTAAITLSGTQTIDGIAVIAGDRVLVKNQGGTASNAANGIYVVSSGAWSRATDADASVEVVSGLYVYSESGSTTGGKGWTLITANPITLDTTPLEFSQFNGVGASVTWSNVTEKPALATKYATSIGDGTNTIYTVTHNLNSMDVTVVVRLVASTYDIVYTDVQIIDVNSVRILFSTAPTTNQYRVIVTG